MTSLLDLAPSYCRDEGVRENLRQATESVDTVQELYDKAGEIPFSMFPYFSEAITIAIDELEKNGRLKKSDELTPEICRTISSWITINFPELLGDKEGLAKYGVDDLRYLSLEFLAILAERLRQQ